MIKRRSPLVAGLLSFFCGGLGQLYNGQPKKLLGYVLWWVFLISTLLVTFRSFTALVVIMTLMLLSISWCVGDAILSARPLREYTLRRYNRWYVYVLYVVLAVTLAPDAGVLKRNYM